MIKIIQYIAVIAILALGYSCANKIINRNRFYVSSVFYYHGFFDESNKANINLRESSQSNDDELLDEIAETILSEPKLIKSHSHLLIESLRFSTFQLKYDSSNKDFPISILQYLPFEKNAFNLKKLYIYNTSTNSNH